jgi:hypothetical protein
MQLPATIKKEPTLDHVRKQFESWRSTRTKRCPIPDELWQAAQSLYPEYFFYHISKALHLNYAGLRQRVYLNRSTVNSVGFIELGMTDSIQRAECLVEMQDPTGAKMTMHFKGKAGLDLLELGKAFWSRRQ